MSELTREKVLAAKVGRELDALVGRIVMNLDLVDDCLPQLPKYYLPEYERTIFRDVPLYSSDISAAWEVVEKFKTHQITHSETGFLHSYQKYRVIVEKNQNIAYSDSVPEAICKAALLAVMEL